MADFIAFETCAICFDPIEFPRKRTCINEQCIRDWTNRVLKRNRDKRRQNIRICLECKSEFILSPPKRTLCSEKCAMDRRLRKAREYNRARRRANRKDIMTRVPFKRIGNDECKICGESLEGTRRISLCGSSKCYSESKRRTLKELYSKKPEKLNGSSWVSDMDKPIGELYGISISKTKVELKESGVFLEGEKDLIRV